MRSAAERVDVGELHAFVALLLERLGLPAVHGAYVADALVDADASGVTTHGTRLLPGYIARLRAGAISPTPQLRVTSRSGAVSALDGDNGLGPVVVRWALEHSLAVARETGVAATTVRRSNHLGALGSYTRRAAEQGMVAFLTQNTRNNMAPAGGRYAAVGNNPFSFTLPCPGRPALVLDLACSAVARSNLELALGRGERIPLGWAVDPAGDPTSDPAQALLGAVLPFAGHKGSGLAVIMGALAGVVSGARFGTSVPAQSDYSEERDLGHFLVLVDLRRFGEPGHGTARMAAYIDEIKNTANESDLVTVPGERSAARRADAGTQGVLLPEPVRSSLRATARALGVPAPFLA